MEALEILEGGMEEGAQGEGGRGEGCLEVENEASGWAQVAVVE